MLNHQLQFVVNIDQSKDFLSSEITQGKNLLKLHEPIVDEALLTGGLRVRRSIKDGFLNKDGFVKPRFQRKYEKELAKLEKESKDAKENMKRRRSEYSVKVSKEVEKELMDLHYEMYLADESLYTGSHDRWIHKEPGIRQIDPETMELGEIPYTEVPQRGGKDGMHNQPWREELYQKQLELGRQLTKEELINFGIMGDSNYGMISTQGGRWSFTHGGRGSGTSRDESIEYQPFTDDEYKRLKDIQSKIIELDDDVEDILDFELSNKGEPVENLYELFKQSFKLFEKMDGGLWGFNANCNVFYVSDFKDKWGLYSIINSCLGYVNKKNVILTVPEKEDFERVLYFYKHKLPIVKRCRYGIKTKYWTNKGGIHDRYDKEKRTEIQNISADMILNNHSDCCYGRKRNNGIIDIRFRSSDPLKLF